MRIEHGEERKEIDIPISEIVLDGGKLNILPSVKKYFSVDYKPKNDKLTLVAGQYIGLIPINDGLAIDIKPKFSISNLTRIVAIAEEKFNTLNFFSRGYHKNENSAPVVFEFMAECLANELEAIYIEGLLKDYLQFSDLTYKIKGRINIASSIKDLWSKGDFSRASINYFDFTANNQYNKLIKITIEYCIFELRKISTNRKDILNKLIELHNIFQSVTTDVNRNFIADISLLIDNDKLSALRHYYVNICDICIVILNRTGISFDVDGNDVTMSTFTLDMANIFEKYLLNVIRKNRDKLPDDVYVLDGNKEGSKKLYNQPSFAKSDAKPDIVIKKGDKYAVIADVKYKSSSKDSDRYQIVTHALSYSAKIAVLLLPKDDFRAEQSSVKLGGIGSEFEIIIHEYYFDLTAKDLEEEENKLAIYFGSILYTIT